MGLDVKLVKVADVLVVPSTEDHELVVMHHGSSVTPTSARNVLRDVDFGADDRIPSICEGFWMLEEVFHVENVEVVQMNVFRVAATEGDDFVLLDCVRCVKSLRYEVVNSLDAWPVPFLVFEVERPEVVQI